MGKEEDSVLSLEKIFEKNGINSETLKQVLDNQSSNSIFELDLKSISPNRFQPRLKFDEAKLKELANSIDKHGVITPIIVRQMGDSQYELVAGERRCRASLLAKKKTIPAIICDFNDKQMMQLSLIENIQREDLSSIEEAKSYNEMKNMLNYTQARLAKEIGKPRSHIANLLRLLTLPNIIQTYIVDNKISTGHAKLLVGLEDHEAVSLANRIIREGLSVREVERIIANSTFANKKSRKEKVNYSEIENTVKDKLQYNKVSVGEKTITLKFSSNQELKEFVKKM